jgi:hypothetical protein
MHVRQGRVETVYAADFKLLVPKYHGQGVQGQHPLERMYVRVLTLMTDEQSTQYPKNLRFIGDWPQVALHDAKHLLSSRRGVEGEVVWCYSADAFVATDISQA